MFARYRQRMTGICKVAMCAPVLLAIQSGCSPWHAAPNDDRPPGKILIFVIDSETGMLPEEKAKFSYFSSLSHGDAVSMIAGRYARRGELHFISVDDPDGNIRRSDYLSALGRVKHHVIQHPQDRVIVNISFGSHVRDPFEESLISDLVGRRVIVVAAAGNNGSERVSLPAGYPGVVAVGAAEGDGRAPYSNYGKRIDFLANGTLHHSQRVSVPTDRGHVQQSRDITVHGTSFAAPEVAAAIMSVLRVEGKEVDAVAILRRAARPIATPAFREGKLGAGKLHLGWKYTLTSTVLQFGDALPDLLSIVVGPIAIIGAWGFRRRIGQYTYRRVRKAISMGLCVHCLLMCSLCLLCLLLLVLSFGVGTNVHALIPASISSWWPTWRLSRILLIVGMVPMSYFVCLGLAISSIQIYSRRRVRYLARKQDLDGLGKEVELAFPNDTTRCAEGCPFFEQRIKEEVLGAVLALGRTAKPFVVDLLLRDSRYRFRPVLMLLRQYSGKHDLAAAILAIAKKEPRRRQRAAMALEFLGHEKAAQRSLAGDTRKPPPEVYSGTPAPEGDGLLRDALVSAADPHSWRIFCPNCNGVLTLPPGTTGQTCPNCGWSS